MSNDITFVLCNDLRWELGYYKGVKSNLSFVIFLKF